MTFKPSAPQKEAMTRFGCDLCVSAGAGSGKTSVLVGRFLHAVTEIGDPPDSILALTFTEKAANHMKRRLVDEFTRLGREADRRALENAYIGTIHGFCARLLRENPIEAGVDPFFTVLPEGEADILMTRAMDSVFEASADRSEWLEVLVEQGEGPVRAALGRLYAQFRALGEDPELLRMDASPAGRKKLETELRALLQEGAGLAAAEPKLAVAKKALTASRRVPQILAKPLGWGGFEETLDLLKIPKQGKNFKSWAESVSDAAKKWQALALEELFAPQKAEFLRVFRGFCRVYEDEKRALSAYDFEDLSLMAFKLLSGGSDAQRAVLERYRARFKHIFVDEFQDTSPLQAKLIELLRRKGGLFVVGDAQQSIFGFRHADPSLFRRYEASMGRVPLAENYRSRSEILEFANGYFARTFPQGTYQALLPSRRFRSEADTPVEAIAVLYKKGTEIGGLEEAREIEAERLASRLAGLVERGAPSEKGPIGWGDIAVLLRSSAAAPVIERALTRRGIPFYSVKPKGFFERPEVKDFVNFLALLDHPEDDVPLAAVLRSPMVGVSDDGLFWLAKAAKKDGPDEPLARALSMERVPGLSDVDRSRARSFMAFLGSARKAKNSVPVSGLLERAAAWSGYECATIAGPGGAQRIANVRKLVDLARSLEQKTPLDADAFVRHLRGMAERDESEFQARVEAEGGDAVLITSIHSAKGLEFPCVAVADLGRVDSFKHKSFIAASIEDGLGWSLKGPEEKERLKDRVFERVTEKLKAAQIEEETRLFYVAMTRAEERLILCGSAEKEEPSGTWMAGLLGHLGYQDSDGWRPASAVPLELVRRPGEPSTSAAPIRDEAVPPKDIDAILRRLVLPEKPYDLAVDLTVTDLLLSAHTGPTFEALGPQDPEALDPEDLERSPKNEYGTIFHRLMEVMARGRPRGALSAEFSERILAPLTDAERRQAAGSAAAFWRSELGGKVAAAGECYPELPFIYKTRYGILKGQIDLVFRDQRGEWTVLDYKTNQVDAATAASVAASYEYQLGLYALVFSKLHGTPPARGMLYFSAIGQAREYVYTPETLLRFEAWLEEAYLRAIGKTEPAP